MKNYKKSTAATNWKMSLILVAAVHLFFLSGVVLYNSITLKYHFFQKLRLFGI
jgi:hypothetical protein